MTGTLLQAQYILHVWTLAISTHPQSPISSYVTSKNREIGREGVHDGVTIYLLICTMDGLMDISTVRRVNIGTD